MKRVGLSLVVLTLTMSLAAIALLAPAASAAPREVAYRCGLDICLLDPDNPADVYNLTFNGATSYDGEPVWSPDGKKLAFVATRNDVPPPTPNVFVMDPGAEGQGINLATQVTHYANGSVPLGELAWSPDGSKIAFARGIASPGSQLLFVAEADGSSAVPLQIAPQGGHPSFSPDGTRIAYWFNKQVYLKSSDGSGAATPLAGAVGREPVWSPDGSRIAFGNPAHPGEFLNLNIVPAGGGTPTVVASNTQFIFASFSPDGAQIAYRNTAPANLEGGYVRVVNADGSGDHGLPVVQGLNFNGPAPSFSPDGSRLVFHGFYFGDVLTEADNTDKVYVANANGTGSVTSLTGDDAYEPAWKPIPKAAPPPPLPPLPGPKIKPKVVWITKRIPWTQGGYIQPMIVFCPVKDCLVKSEATAKSGGARVGPRPRPAAASAKAKPRLVVVGRGKVKIPAGKSRPVKLRVTKKGAALIKARGSIELKVTAKIAIAGQKTTVLRRAVRVYLATKK